MTSYSELKLHIDGEWLGAGSRRTHRVINPANGATLGELPLVDTADLDRALQAAERGYRLWKRSTAEERGRVLKGAAQLIRQRVEHIARVATLEEGKTIGETRVEALVTANLFEFYGEECRRTYGRVLVRPTGTRSMVMKEPVGPVAAFAPWNFPIANPGRKLGAPIAAGCSVILKPAEEAPAAAIEVVRALLDAGLPPGVCQLVFGVPDEVSRHLLASPIIRKLSFTGSTAVGKNILRAGAETLKRVTLELGGKSPVLVMDDADFAQAVPLAIQAGFMNSGQACIAGTRILVPRARLAEFEALVRDEVGRTQVGDPRDPATLVGPMVSQKQWERVQRYIRIGIDEGARLLTGGEGRPDGLEGGWFIRPTVFTDVRNDMTIAREEIFGPVLSIIAYDDLEDAIAIANDTLYGLQA
jgi:succinate-semialdehyde dehydrogenase/glutarate-semialdehyde dehydrogenase